VAAPIADLRRVPLFGGLSERQLKKLARDFRPRAFRAGAAVVRQGEMSGVGFFIVTAGEARVSVVPISARWTDAEERLRQPSAAAAG
jgi:CRP-like cAMP-binding protein